MDGLGFGFGNGDAPGSTRMREGGAGDSTVLLADRGMILIDLLIEFESLGEPSPESHQLSSWPMKKIICHFFPITSASPKHLFILLQVIDLGNGGVADCLRFNERE